MKKESFVFTAFVMAFFGAAFFIAALCISFGGDAYTYIFKVVSLGFSGILFGLSFILFSVSSAETPTNKAIQIDIGAQQEQINANQNTSQNNDNYVFKRFVETKRDIVKIICAKEHFSGTDLYIGLLKKKIVIFNEDDRILFESSYADLFASKNHCCVNADIVKIGPFKFDNYDKSLENLDFLIQNIASATI